jgi:hydrogenase nickel incorporation protein HypA/HybF
MHEYGLCEGIVDAVQQRAAGRRVVRVRVRIGALHHAVEAAFRQAFAHVASGTEAEDAALELVVIPARALCRTCQVEVECADALMICPRCEGIDLELTAGDELILESLEYAGPAADDGAKE